MHPPMRRLPTISGTTSAVSCSCRLHSATWHHENLPHVLIMATTQNSSKHVRRRKVADLNEEQRERKRNTDRQAQQAFRERTKAQIQDLEDELESMRQHSTENEEIWRAENARLRDKVRQLTRRLEHIQRLANGRLDSQPEASSPARTSPKDPQRTIPRPSDQQGSASPESTIVVREAISPAQSLNHDLRDSIEPLLAPPETANNAKSQMLVADDGLGHDIIEDSLRNATSTHQEPTGNPFGSATAPTIPHMGNPSGEHGQDVLMSSYETISADRIASTPSHDLWMHQASSSAHTMSPPFVQHSPQYRREVHEVVCEHFRTCPFDHILLDLVDARRALLSSGSRLEEAIGPAQADVAGLFQASKLLKSHQISRILVEMMHTFAHVNLPERAAFMYKIHKTLRVRMAQVRRESLTCLPQWQIAPSQSTFEVLPSWLRPTVRQITTPHAAWIDNIPW